jgi:protein CpxP
MRISMQLLAPAAIVLALSATAQQGARSQIQRLVDQLNVSADQKAKLDPILDDDAKKVRALRDDTALSAEDRRAKTAAIRTDTDAKIKPILTDEQYKKLEQLREERKAQGKGKKKQ